MGKYQKILRAVLSGSADKNIAFNDLCHLLRRLDFVEHISGSHHLFRRPGIAELINLQRDDNKAKMYQVRQVRDIILRYDLGRELDA